MVLGHLQAQCWLKMRCFSLVISDPQWWHIQNGCWNLVRYVITNKLGPISAPGGWEITLHVGIAIVNLIVWAYCSNTSYPYEARGMDNHWFNCLNQDKTATFTAMWFKIYIVNIIKIQVSTFWEEIPNGCQASKASVKNILEANMHIFTGNIS